MTKRNIQKKHDLTIVFFLAQKEAAVIAGINFSNYFYGGKAMQFTYFRILCQLITHLRFNHLSTDSKLLYGMLLDRMSLSIKNEWYDETRHTSKERALKDNEKHPESGVPAKPGHVTRQRFSVKGAKKFSRFRGA